jgi:hypothetical protein
MSDDLIKFKHSGPEQDLAHLKTEREYTMEIEAVRVYGCGCR